MLKKVKINLFYFVAVAVLATGCGAFEDKEEVKPNGDLVSQNVGVAAPNAQLKVLVAYTDNTTFSTSQGTSQFTRLKLVTELELQQTMGYQYLGRAYAFANGGDAFSVPMHEYFIPIDPRYSTIGFHYSMFNGSVPTYGWQPNTSAVAYVSSYPDLSRGVVPLYQYATPGGVFNPGTGNVEFTLNSAIIEGIRLSGVPIMWKIVGFVYHGTQVDCDANRSPFCGANIGVSP